MAQPRSECCRLSDCTTFFGSVTATTWLGRPYFCGRPRDLEPGTDPDTHSKDVRDLIRRLDAGHAELATDVPAALRHQHARPEPIRRLRHLSGEIAAERDAIFRHVGRDVCSGDR